MIWIGSDHAGYETKEHIRDWLRSQNITFKDIGAYNNKPSDYPLFAYKIADKVKKNPQDKGILFCRSGQGMSIVANRVRGVRAALCWNSKVAYESRRDNDSNILSVPSGYVNVSQAEDIIKSWLNTKNSTEARHIRRIRQIDQRL